jgi:hypothetical protein
MQSLKLVLDVGLQFIPGVGKILDAGLGMWSTEFGISGRLLTYFTQTWLRPQHKWPPIFTPKKKILKALSAGG